jgi:hypothetical protein
MRSVSAPVNAPRLWPNNSDSISVGLSAERFNAKNVPESPQLNSVSAGVAGKYCERPIARATSSFPDPVGPHMSAVKSFIRANSTL